MATKPQLPNARVAMGAAPQSIGDRTLRFIGTDETRDRYNTYFVRDGWNFDNFRKNPVFLFHHNHDGSTPTLPIGRVVNIAKTDASGSPGWAFDVKFADRELYPFADVVYNMYREGFMNAVSVGFSAQKVRELEPAEAKELGFAKGWAAIIEQTELTELSAVPVPGNQNALIQREALPQFRALVPAAYRDAIVAEDGEELDAKWLAGQLARLYSALAADKAVENMDAVAAAVADVVTPDPVITTNTAAAPVAAPAALTRDEHLAAMTELSAALNEQFEKLSRELADLRTELRAAREVPPAPAPVAASGAPGVPLAGTSPERAPKTLDPVELVLAENVDALRRIAGYGSAK